ncbi:hypothetical protein TPA0598_03_05230 [Streptomyces lydicamycinicus]|uniref:Uncharacterized protein n=1 Tax=Streptomyces lydicamycinicus TaxID=1546107 RepID=A0A0P4R6N3_9ACTN|nr:hypothetical protein TPA0598_03_05230 [Streptomyces lydicamycinicus]
MPLDPAAAMSLSEWPAGFVPAASEPEQAVRARAAAAVKAAAATRRVRRRAVRTVGLELISGPPGQSVTWSPRYVNDSDRGH